MVNKESTIGGFIVGFLSAGLIGVLASLSIYDTSSNDKAKIYPYENNLKIIRTNEIGRRDQVFIEEFQEKADYISVKKYLNSIENKQDRAIEKAKIEKIVGEW